MAGLLAAAGASAESFDVEIHPAVIQTYDVHGRTRDELGTNLGPGHVADTRWRVEWKYRFESTKACRLTSFRVDVTARIRMPRWVERGAAAPKLRASWDAFDSALRKHEEGHREHGIEAGREIAREARSLGARGDCAALRAEVERMANAVIDRFHLQDEAYDRATQHGVRQGAILR
jgi:predicted secreted Zn-dependent protease